MENSVLHNEQHLLAKIASGDERAFHEVIRHYHGSVLYHALTFTKSLPDAEEITQDIFMKIWEQRLKLPEIDSFRDYLFVLGRNQIISSMRKRLMVTEVPDNHYLVSLLTPDKAYEEKEITAIINKGISLLPPQQQNVFRLSRLEHLTHEQIAERLHISKHAVNWHMVKALNFLRLYLGRYGDGLIFFVLGYWVTK